jgi:hypothetical protein
MQIRPSSRTACKSVRVVGRHANPSYKNQATSVKFADLDYTPHTIGKATLPYA